MSATAATAGALAVAAAAAALAIALGQGRAPPLPPPSAPARALWAEAAERGLPEGAAEHFAARGHVLVPEAVPPELVERLLLPELSGLSTPLWARLALPHLRDPLLSSDPAAASEITSAVLALVPAVHVGHGGEALVRDLLGDIETGCGQGRGATLRLVRASQLTTPPSRPLPIPRIGSTWPATWRIRQGKPSSTKYCSCTVLAAT
ncbi:unnamed protein product [Prorocentrum cordatum]|uniref:Uncharacterized protein n=1 Tax=Prorocentrum cordatum TaxID=2364126 RepID=A0ABN9TLD6_9DINO|nr:unnamed protein product [Polarella glacialis]